MSRAEERYQLLTLLWGVVVLGSMFLFSEWMWPSAGGVGVAYAQPVPKERANWYQNELRNVLYAPSGDYLSGPSLAPSQDITDTLTSILAVDEDILGNVKAQATVVANQAQAQATAAAAITSTMQAISDTAGLVNQGVYAETRLLWNVAIVAVVLSFLAMVGLVWSWLR